MQRKKLKISDRLKSLFLTLFIVFISITVIAGTVTAGAPVTTPVPTANTGTTPSVSSSGGVGDTTSGGSASSDTITPGGQISIGSGFHAEISGSQSTLITFTPLDSYKVAQIVATEILKLNSGSGSKDVTTITPDHPAESVAGKSTAITSTAITDYSEVGGKVVRETYTDPDDGSRSVAETTTYPSGNTKEVYTQYDSKGNVKEIFVVVKSKDSEGNPVVRSTDTLINSDGSKFITESEGYTDSEGNKIEKKVIGGSVVIETTTRPDGSGESTEKEYKSGVLEKTTATTTYSDGSEYVSETTYDKDGNVMDYVGREYDENGLLTYSSGDSDDKSSSGVSQSDRWSQ